MKNKKTCYIGLLTAFTKNVGIFSGALFLTLTAVSAVDVTWPEAPTGEEQGGKIGSALYPEFSTITNTAKVGIGTNAPEEALHVVGSGVFEQAVWMKNFNLSKYDVDGSSKFLTTKEYVDNALSGFSAGKFVDGTDANNAVYTAGNIGIGTTSPAENMTVSTAVTDGTTDTFFRLNNTAASATGRPAIDWYNTAGDMSSARISSKVGGGYTQSILYFDVADASKTLQERMVINTHGVGIGITDPVYPLHMTSNAGNGNIVYLETGTGGDGARAITIDRPNTASESNFGFSTGGNSTWLIGPNNDGVDDLVFYNTSAWKRTLTLDSSSNNVGINNVFNPEEALHVNGNIKADAYLYSSDERLKENITALESGLTTINSVQAVNFDWIESGKSDIGFIAQDIEKYYPEFVSTSEINGYKAVDYSKMVVPLVAAVQELSAQNEALKALVCEDKPEAEICK